MKTRNIGVVIRREYLNRVKKKSFLVITFVVPVLFVALCCLPTLIMLNTKEAAKEISVIDRSGIVAPALADNETVTFIDKSDDDVDAVKALVAAGESDALLLISPMDVDEKTVNAETYSLKPLGIDMTENLNRQINDAVEGYRVSSYGIEGLQEIMDAVKPHIKLRTITLDEDGGETISESGVYMMVSMLLGMVIFMFVTLFGGMVMSGVIEEKSSRVVEVLVSSVKSIELMYGKIIGIALVAFTQFLLWIVLALVLFVAAGAFLPPELMSSVTADPAALAGVDGLTEAVPSETGIVLSTLANLPLVKILVSFILYFIFGYLLYASLYAAIGSAVENEGDSQQLQLPVTIPLMLAFFIALYAFKAPDSALVFWGSMIPFTSPIVMLARIPFGVEIWELALSLAVLAVTFVICAYISSRIYRVGILMFGRKSTFKDLWKWFKQK